MEGTELDASGKGKRRNCRYCALQKKPDMKTVFVCEKCKVPLHIHCFKERIFFSYELNFFNLNFFKA